MSKRLEIVAVAGLVALVLTGCATPGGRPPDHRLPPAAEPRSAPAQHSPLTGRIVTVGQAPEGVAVDSGTRTVAVATRHPNQLVVMDADTAAVITRTPLPGVARHVELASSGSVLVPIESAGALVRVDLPSGKAARPVATGTAPHDAAAAANGTVFVSNELGGSVAVVRDNATVTIFNNCVQPAGMAAVANTVGMLDARANDLTIYDAGTMRIVGSTPAGEGPTHLIADRHGRMIAADTRGNTVRVFTPLPTPRQVGSVAQPGGPYGIAYDTVRDRLWVASSGGNEVVGYDMSSSEPVQIKRFSTVQNPYSLGVDEQSGRLYVAGVTGGVLQIIDTAQ